MLVAVPIAEQGRVGLNGLGPIDNARLAPDPDTILKLAESPRDLHWSLSWRVGAGAWRHVHIDRHNDPSAPRPQPRYVYWGAQTKIGGSATSQAQKILVGSMDLRARRAIENIAWTVPVMQPDGIWNCQNWINALLLKLLEGRVINQRTWEGVLNEVSRGE
ncbi:hypothetical protein BD413DRAFT_601835 [Trametes elegans]|nr:hypothetical protein BD413DRAFT_601835 [Trametes elegans]